MYSLCAVFFEVWTGSKFIQFKHADPAIIREEMAFSLETHYPELSPPLREKLISVLLGGLRPRAERISLSYLQTTLIEIQQTWQKGGEAAEAVATARAQVSQQIKKPPQQTVVSNLPQLPVAAKSRPFAALLSPIGWKMSLANGTSNLPLMTWFSGTTQRHNGAICWISFRPVST